MCRSWKPWSSLWVSNSWYPRSHNCKPLFPGYYSVTWIPPHTSVSFYKSRNGLSQMRCDVVASVRGQVMTETHLLKLARFCITLAMSVSVRDVRSAGYSCIRLNREGDMMAGHMKRRNREELMRLSARSSLPRSAHLALHEAKTSFSSRGNMLKPEHGFIAHCQGEQRDKNQAALRNSARSGD